MSTDQGPNMEMRAFIAVALSLFVMLIYQYFFVPPPPPPTQQPAGVGDAEPTTVLDPAAVPPVATGTTTSPNAIDPEQLEVVDADIFAERQESVVIESERFRMVVSNRGGLITSLELNDWESDFGGPLQMIVDELEPVNPGWLKLVAPDDPAEAERANTALYRMTVNGFEPGATVRVSEPTQIRWQWAEGDRRVEKTLTVTPDTYLFSLAVRAQTPTNTQFFLTVGPGLEAHADTSRTSLYLMSGALFLLRQNGVEHIGDADIEGAEGIDLAVGSGELAPHSGAHVGQVVDAVWGGLQSNYFAALFVPDGPSGVYLDAVPIPAQPAGEDGTESATEAPSGSPGTRALIGWHVPPGGFDMPLYVGPKSYGLLESAGHGLERAVDYGTFRMLARPVAVSLEWLYGFVGNYGLAIILATLGVRILFFPLSQSSMKSMRRMQQLQPQMNAIRNRYKGVKDMEKKQQMNAEVMQLYKDNGVSPLGGCVPMLLQMPVLFGFYAAISVSIDIRQAPFALWIQDLSKMDPFYVLPLLMGASMFAQQRMSPGTGDPVQQRIFRLMPIIFTFFFLSFPSGLVMYWLLNTVLGIGQQAYVNHQLGSSDAVMTPSHKPKGGKGKKGGGGKRKKRGK